jgi:drug/metabolite transporter (DMT)-like permease
MPDRSLPYLAFSALCFLFGTSYAVVSRAIRFSDGTLISFLRMCFAALAALSVLFVRMRRDPGYSAHIRNSMDSGSVSIPRMIFCGILNYGFPHSLITVAQRTVSSVAVTIAQPVVALVALLATRVVFPEETITVQKLIPQALALTGTVLTSIPSFGGGGAGAQLFDYCLLGIAVVSFGIGAVYLKWAFPVADGFLLCAGQLAGSAVYGVLFSFLRLGSKLLEAFAGIQLSTVVWALVLGLVYTFSTAMLWIYVVRELGPVKANFANFGQIVIGVIAGVLFLGEWKEYGRGDIGLSLVGLGFLTLSILAGFLVQEKRRGSSEGKEAPYSTERLAQRPLK